MKRALMLTLAAGGLMLASSDDAGAHDYFRGGRSSGFGVSLNFGSPTGYRNNFGYNRGFSTPYRGYIQRSPNSYLNYRTQRSVPRYRHAVPGYGGYRGNGYLSPGFGVGYGGRPTGGFGGYRCGY